MRLNHWNGLLVVMLVLTGAQARAADIDLFAGVRPAGADAPNVLIVLDNAANFSASVTGLRCSITAAGDVKVDGTGSAPTKLDGTAGAVEQCALYSAIQALEAKSDATVNLGLMGFNNNGMKQFNPATNTFSAACVGGAGGCLLMPLTPLNASNKPNVLEWIRNWALSGGGNYVIKANNSANGAVMQEAWAYFFGKVGVSGRDYASIAPAGGCARKNVIFVGNNYRNNATPGDETNEDSSPLRPLNGTSLVLGKRAAPIATAAQLASVTGTLSSGICGSGTTTLQTAEGKGAYALNWARYMKAQDVTTFSIGVLGPTCNAEYAGHLAKLGADEIGGGKYFATTNYEELKKAFLKALGEVQSVNSVFAAVSLPVSVNTQGSYLNRVYVGMFRPQKHFNPRWDGNLKQYKLGEDGGVLRLLDADDVRAVNNLTGFITECARSYWTPNTTDNYWELDPRGGCLTVAGASSSNYPDGNIVEKGAQAYKLRSLTPSARTAKTCSPVFASCTSMTDFVTTNTAITQNLLNPGGTDRDVLINWARGTNVDDELSKGTTVMRPSVHGDVVHSRPAPVNHGSATTPSIVVYYGGNDGMLRAVNGNRGSATDASVGSITSGGKTYAAGAEMWSFMPPEFYGKIKRLRNNDPSISFPGSPATDAKPKDYGIDGPLTAFQGVIGGSTQTYVYATMRRGGRVLYAFDVTIPGSPALLWKKGCPNAADNIDCSTGFSGVGETWSSLKTMYASGYGSGTSPLLITGGGYDTCEDYDAGTIGGKNHNCAVATTKGNKVFVLDAATGAVVKAFNTDRAVIADSTIVRDSSNMIKYAYTADMGGNVYRMDFGGGAPDSWSITKIASLGCNTPADCTDSVPNRKFMFAPSVATTDNETYYVLLGSGDREKPVKDYVSSGSVTNYFFMLKDKPSATDWLSSESATCGANVMCKGSLLAILTSATPSDADLATKKGWYLGLTTQTEQVVTSSVIVFGVVTFSTHQPATTAANACTSNLGTTRVYNISYLNTASANGTDSRYEHLIGDGLPPSPVAGLVTLDNGKKTPFCIGCSKNSPLEGSPPKELGSVSRPKGRLYWYLQK